MEVAYLCFCGMSSKLMIIRQFFELRQRYQLPLFKECIIYRPNEIHIVFRKRGESRYGIYTWSSRNNSCTFLHRTVVRLILRMGTVRMGWCIKFPIKKDITCFVDLGDDSAGNNGSSERKVSTCAIHLIKVLLTEDEYTILERSPERTIPIDRCRNRRG